MNKKYTSIIVIVSIMVILLLAACNTQFGFGDITTSSGGMRVMGSVRYLTFEDAAQAATDVVVAEFVAQRPFGESLTEFEFIVHERIFGNAADRIFVYTFSSTNSAIRVVGGSFMDDDRQFTTNTQYLLLLEKLANVYANTHEDGFLFLTNLVLDLDDPSGSTMHNESLSRHSSGMNFNSRSLTKDMITSYVRALTQDNTPVRDYIRSDKLVDIIEGSPYILVVEIAEPRSLSSEGLSTDWMETDIYYVTVVEVLEGDMQIGDLLQVIFFANTVFTGERHIVAITPSDPNTRYFYRFTSRNSLFRMDQLGEILEILGNQVPPGDTRLTLHIYDGSGDYFVIPVEPNSRLCPTALAPVIARVNNHAEAQNLAFWGWFTDEQLNSSGRTRNGHRRPTVGAADFNLDTVFTGALMNSLAVDGNINLYAVWARWGDVNDDGLVNGIDVSRLSQYVRRFPGLAIVRPAAYVSRGTMITGLDVSLISQYVRRFPGIVLGATPSRTVFETDFGEYDRMDAAEFRVVGDAQAWSVSHASGNRGGYIDIRLSMDQITQHGMCWTMFVLDFDTSVLSNPRLSTRIDRSALTPELQEAYDTLPPFLFEAVLGPFRGGNHVTHNMIFEGVLSWNPGEVVVSWQSNPNPAIANNFTPGIFVDVRFDILTDAPLGEFPVTISTRPSGVFLGGVGAVALPITWDHFTNGSVTVLP